LDSKRACLRRWRSFFARSEVHFFSARVLSDPSALALPAPRLSASRNGSRSFFCPIPFTGPGLAGTSLSFRLPYSPFSGRARRSTYSVASLLLEEGASPSRPASRKRLHFTTICPLQHVVCGRSAAFLSPLRTLRTITQTRTFFFLRFFLFFFLLTSICRRRGFLRRKPLPPPDNILFLI